MKKIKLIIALLILSVKTIAQSTDPLYIDSSGKVGIGTNIPQQQLDVNGAVSIGKAGKINISTDRLNGSINNTTGYLMFYTPRPNAFTFNTGTTELLRLNTSNGYLGIGTSNPFQKLHVAGSGLVDSSFHIRGNTRIGYTNTASLDVGGFIRVSDFGDSSGRASMPPDIQGLYMGWNKSGHIGESNFINNIGLGSGGFYFQNIKNNTLTDLVMINGDGSVNVKGPVTAPTINGEDKPLTYTMVGNTRDWTALVIEDAIIRQYLYDGDGATIKLLINRKDGTVRIRTINIYVGQPIAGGALPAGAQGGNNSFKLNSTDRSWYFLNVEGMSMANYHDAGRANPRTTQGPWRGSDAFRVEFTMDPALTSCTIMIFDR